MKTCEQCGKQFEPSKHRKTVQRFCSDKCSNDWWHGTNKRYEFTCQQCGKVYQTAYQDRNKFCSRECAFACHHETKLQRERDKAEGIGEFCSIWPRLCKQCGNPFLARNKRRKLCSRECQLAWGRRQWNDKAQGKHPVVTIVCPQCGKAFTYTRKNRTKKFCSMKCNRDHQSSLHPEWKVEQRHTRRAKQYGNGPCETINPNEIFERDGWRCGICGKKVNKSLKHPDLMSATLDHIIPLAKGGTHVRSNVQLAHMICNSRKNDVGSGQLILDIWAVKS